MQTRNLEVVDVEVITAAEVDVDVVGVENEMVRCRRKIYQPATQKSTL